MCVEWIDLFTNYTTYKIGLPPKRAEWMRNWVMKLASEGRTTPKAFEQGLGHRRSGQKGDCETSSDVESDFALLGREVQGGRTDAGSAPTEAGRMKWPRPRTVVLHGRQGLATENGAWIGGYPQGQGGKILAWFSEEVSSELCRLA